MFAFDALWSWLIRAAVFSSLALVVGGVAICRMRQPAERLRLIQWVLAACLIAPCLPVSSVWRTVSVSFLEPTSNSISSVPPTAPEDGASRASFVDSMPFAATHPPLVAEHAIEAKPSLAAVGYWSLPQALVAVWAFAAGATILWWLAGMWSRASLLRGGHAPSAALLHAFHDISGPSGSRVRLIVSDAIDSPITWGAIRPVIVVPRKLADDATSAELRWGLAHEWSHVKQRDMASLWLAFAAQLICFYQPLYWMLRRRMLLCQDYIADAFAANYAESSEDYAAFLVRMAKHRLQPSASLSLGIADRKSQLSHRVRMLVTSRTDVRPNCRKRVALCSACGALLGMLFLTTIELDAKEPQVQPSGSPAASSANATDGESLEANVVSGILIDAANGQPVVGAQVLLRSGRVDAVASDAEGKFRFEKVSANSNGYELWAYRDNLITARTQVKQSSTADAAAATFEPLRLEMKPGMRAGFRVTSQETGLPIADARVRIGYPDRRTTTTDKNGQAAVIGLGPEQYDVTVEAPGYARDASQLDLGQKVDVADFAVALRPGGEVRGVVVDEHGQPVPEADVGYRESDGIGFHGDAFRTDPNGEFRHRFLPLGAPLKISIDKRDFVPVEQSLSLTASQPTRELRLTLARRPDGGSVAGVVRDQEGKPLAGAKVANYGNRSSQERLTTTDAEGRFVLHDLFDSSRGIYVRVSAKDFAPQGVTIEATGTAQAPAELSVTLEPGHSLRGRIVNEAGKPVGGAYIMARSSVFRWGMESVRADDQGEFVFNSLPAEVQFDVSHPQYPSSRAATFKLDETEPVTITLEDPGVIKGQVLDAKTKQPLQQFHIRLGFSRDRRPSDANGSYNGSWSDPGLTFQESEGRFKIEPLVAGMPLELIVEADGYERFVVPRAVALKSASATDVSVALTPVSPVLPYALNVQLLNDAGKPIPDVQLRLIVSTDQPKGKDDNAYNWVLIDSGQLGDKSYVEQFLAGVTNAEGKCAFPNITPGKYLQLAYWGEGAPKGRSLAFDVTRPNQTDNVVIDVPRPAIVRGSFDRAKIHDAGGVQISSSAESFLSFEAKLKADQSTFEFRDLPPGSYWASVVSKPVTSMENGHEMHRISPLASQKIVLKAGEEKEVHFDEPDPPQN